MIRPIKMFALAGLAYSTLAATTSQAGVGDLLVAPTRLILNGGRGAEVIIKNAGDKTATYRISVELRRMLPNGSLVEVKDANDIEKAAQDMIIYAPRKVVLPPNQPQSIRIAARPAAGLPDGEYRVHVLFRAIPEPNAAGQRLDGQSVGFRLIPIYGVTIPVIIRFGNLQATAGIANVKLGESASRRKVVTVDLSRSGNRSTYGDIRVLKDGMKEPLAEMKGVAIYPELTARSVEIPIAEGFEAQAKGPVKVQYFENSDSGAKLVAETSATLR